jgi:hypothetical protein
MSYRSKSTRRHSYAVSGGGYTRKSTRGVTATGTPYTMTSVNPAPTTTTSTSEQSPSFSVGSPFRGGHPGLVFMLAITLFVVATWDGFGKPAFNSLMSNADFTPSIPFPMMVGGIVFVIILSAISQADDSDLALYFIVGLWMLYVLFYGQKTWASIWNWLGGNDQNVVGGGAFGTFGNVFKKASPLPDTSGTPIANASVPQKTVTL